MGWSTRRLAELGGTTLSAVRHYHEVGLLPEPPRTSNGYKQYGVAHLVRLMQIRRLTGLGLSLDQIATYGNDGNPAHELELVDADLAKKIDELQAVRDEIAVVREHGGVDLPVGFSSVTDGLTETDRKLITAYSSVFSTDTMKDLREILPTELTDADREFSALPLDADVATRARLAAQMAPGLRAQYAQHPWLPVPESRAPASQAGALRDTVNQAMTTFYNMAQIEVVYRAHLLATDQHDDRLEQAAEDESLPE